MPDFIQRYLVMIPLEYRDPLLLVATLLGFLFFTKWAFLIARWLLGSLLGFLSALLGIDIESWMRPKGFCYCDRCAYRRDISDAAWNDVYPGVPKGSKPVKLYPYRYQCIRDGGSPVRARDFCSQGLKER